MSERHTTKAHINQSPQSSGDFFVPKTKDPTEQQKSIVITGGPSTGKTTALKHLKTKRSDLAYIGEAATMVLSSGFPTPDEERPWTQRWQNSLQIAIAGMQLGLESATHEYASSPVIQDRGLLDGASYLERGVDEFEELIGIDRQTMLKRYHAVIYLGWLTTRTYSNTNNPQRFEDESRAKHLSEKVRQCWGGHPNLIEIHDQDNRAAKIEKLLPALLGERQ